MRCLVESPVLALLTPSHLLSNTYRCLRRPALRVAQLSEGAAPVRQAALRAEKVVDTTGAGDCFTAAFAVALLEGERAPQEALRFASAAACLCVQRLGAMPSLPHRAEVDALLAAEKSERPAVERKDPIM